MIFCIIALWLWWRAYQFLPDMLDLLPKFFGLSNFLHINLFITAILVPFIGYFWGPVRWSIRMPTSTKPQVANKYSSWYITWADENKINKLEDRFIEMMPSDKWERKNKIWTKTQRNVGHQWALNIHTKGVTDRDKREKSRKNIFKNMAEKYSNLMANVNLHI